MKVIKSDRGLIKAWTEGVPVEDSAIEQLKNVADLPFVRPWVAAMPDVHWGMGATVGSVIPTVGAIIPAAVGVDIGCGMVAAKTNWKLVDLKDPSKIRQTIESVIPHGRTNNGGKGDRGAWGTVPLFIQADWESDLEDRYESICNIHPEIRKANALPHLGTLGTGNHFIEVSVDENDEVWVVVHSGSRGVGNKIGTYFIRKAKELMKQYFINLSDPNLAYFPKGTGLFFDYMLTVEWAQQFAKMNRSLMMNEVLSGLGMHYQDFFDCHHNYVELENHHGENVYVTRKGAVRAREGDLGIIPGSMGAKSFIVRGKGNPESFHSCSHGAGRLMSRTEAKKRFTVQDHEEATKGIECKKDDSVLDETPGAYKSIDAVMEAQKDLVEIVHTLKQVVCVKG